MLREAKRCVHILVDPLPDGRQRLRKTSGSPARAGLSHLSGQYVQNRHLIFLMLFAAALLSTGCGVSSPRFGNHEHTRGASGTKEKPRFTSSETEEERRGDDKKVDPKEIQRVTESSRSFTKEKNPAIKPLDQSKMMREISKYMGVPYVHGGASADGMDCSGYTMTVYRDAVGVRLPRSSVEQSKLGGSVDFQNLKFGDLLFFNTTGESASHVGIYLGDDLFAHASVSLGVTISSLQSSYFKERYETARRILE
jgi:lipoprotein Spr/probable lipoprotein NlpC